MYIVIAIAGGVARTLTEYLETSELRLGRLLAGTAVGGFSGFIFAQVIINLSPQWATVMAGVGGFLGGEGMKFLADILKRRIKKEAGDDG